MRKASSSLRRYGVGERGEPRVRTVMLIASIASVPLTSCSTFDREEIQDCEDALVRSLKSPSSYKAIKKGSVLISDNRKRYQSVSIEYDADNSYGAAIRDTHICVYPVDGKRVRVDIGAGDISEALAGRGLFAPGARFPTEREQEQKRQAYIDAITNETDADDGKSIREQLEESSDRLENAAAAAIEEVEAN